MEIDVRELSVRDRYKLLIGCIVPRPIAFVSTLSVDGSPNLAPFSFFNGVGSEPMTLLFCPGNKPDGSDKDTLRNCLPEDEGGIGQFVVNASVEEYQRQVAGAAEALPYGESEFELTALESAPSTRVRPPRVAASPWAFECETLQVIRLCPGAAGGGNVVIGRVVHVHLKDDLADQNLHIDYSKLHAIGRLGGLGYATTRERFEQPMGRSALAGPPEGPPEAKEKT